MVPAFIAMGSSLAARSGGRFLFASEAGHAFDDTKCSVATVSWLNDDDRHEIYDGNARRADGRVGSQIERQAAW